jgi:hypothetical protein
MSGTSTLLPHVSELSFPIAALLHLRAEVRELSMVTSSLSFS